MKKRKLQQREGTPTNREADRRKDRRQAAEDAWALAAWYGRWFVSGLVRNVFPHQARRGKAARRWERLGEE